MDLVAKISLDSGDYEKNLDSAKTSFSSFGSALSKGAKTVGTLAVGAVTALSTAVVGATTALVNGAKETAAYADNIDKMSQKMGFSAEAFQEWDFIMQHNGSSIEAVKSSIVKLNSALESDTDAWEKLGLSQEELLNMNSEERFEATIAALQGVTDETEKAALAQDIFGKSYQEVLPLLNMTAEETEAMKQEVHDLGGVMDDEAVKAGANFQDSLKNLQTAISGVKNNLMGEFLPSITEVMDGLTALFTGDESGIGKIQSGIQSFAEKINESLPAVISTVSSVAQSLIGALPQLLQTVSAELPTILNSLIPVVIDAVVALADSVVSALPSIMDAIKSNIGVISSGLSKIFTALGKIILTLLPTLLPTMLQVAVQLVQELAKGFSENASSVIQTIFELIDVIVEELTNPETLMSLLECGIAILTALINGISENLPMLLETCGTLISNIVSFLFQAIPELVVAIGENGATIVSEVLPTILLKIGDAVSDILKNIGDWIGQGVFDLKQKADELFAALPDALADLWDSFSQDISDFVADAVAWFAEKFLAIKQVGTDLVEGLWNGINDAKDWVLDKIEGFGDAILDGLKSFFGIASPSKVMRDVVGKNLALGIAEGFDDEADDAFASMQRALDEGMRGLDVEDLGISAVGSVGISGGYKGMSQQRTMDAKLDDILSVLVAILKKDPTIEGTINVDGWRFGDLVTSTDREKVIRSGGVV